MRVTIDFKGELGELLAQAREMTGIENTSVLCNTALEVLADREKARRLDFLVNSGQAKLPKRRRSR